MPIRKFNYTQRKRIHERDALIAVAATPSGEPIFDAQLSLESYRLPDTANVALEAYRQNTWMRFEYGTISNPSIPADRTLREFESAEGVRFRVKVTSSDLENRKILAEAEGIRPKGLGLELENDRRVSLFSVKSSNTLGEQPFRLSTDVGQDGVFLLEINNKLGDYRAVARSQMFVSLVYPSILREALFYVAIVLKHREHDGDGLWCKTIQLARNLSGSYPPTSNADDDEESRTLEWIDSVVDAFSKNHTLATGLGQAFSSGGGQ